MLKVFKSVDFKKTGIFAAGVLFGTAGIKVLGSKDAKKVYTNCTAAVLRAKESVMKTATNIQENAEDIYAEAQQINEDRAAAETEEFEDVEEVSEETPVKILNNILDYAVEAGLIEENTTTYRDLFDARIMGLLMPRESEIVKEFYNKYENESKEKATSWFYDLSKSSNYIMTQRIAKNLWWPVQTEYGDLEITINLSKPEKDPKEIAKAKLMKQLTYPKCLLCKENVGYAGRINHPARQNHRIIPMTLGNKDWFLQYSPYVYYNEHCIVFSGEHEQMKLTKNSIERLVEFTEVLPHYFIGSNADLPIVGGSILTHDHYQGGRHEFPMEKAKVEKYYESSKYKNLEIGIVKWPMSVVRIKGKDKNEVINATMDMFEAWKKYSDEENEILAFTGDTPHNTVTPIARRKDEAFEIDIVLRNNRASEEHPDGIFHPHKELHHIKKENIGLIEVMGLAVLPGRLEKELDIIANILCGEISYNREKAQNNEEINKHIPWIEKMLSENLSLNYLEAKELIKKEVGIIFSRVLEDAGVFKRNEKGQEGFNKFLNKVI